MKKFKLFALTCFSMLLVSLSGYASAQGKIDFADLTSHYGQPKVEINLTPGLMKLVGSFASSEDPEVGNILSNLESIKVRVYNLNDDLEKASSTVEEVSSQLRADNWETLVTVNDNEANEKVRIFSKSSDNVIDGVVVMVVSPQQEEEKDGGEAIFINIVGQIDPDQIGKVAETLDIDIN